MTDQEINVTIAEACGWTVAKDKDGGWRACDSEGGFTKWQTEENARNIGWPSYTTDLNAMHEAEKVLDSVQIDLYKNYLSVFYISPARIPHSATASQRSEAFLRTIGKWRAA